MSQSVAGRDGLVSRLISDGVQASRLYLNTRKNSSADLRGSLIKSAMTATESAPASITERQFARVIPPMATSGLWVNERASRTPSGPITGSGRSLLLVANTGPMARYVAEVFSAADN